MTSYTLQDLERLVQGGSNDTSRNQGDHDTSHQPPLAPAHIRTRIYNAVVKANGVVSRADIAKALGVKKTPWLLQSIEGLVSDGYLTRTQTIRANGVVMFWYEVKR